MSLKSLVAHKGEEISNYVNDLSWTASPLKNRADTLFRNETIEAA